jgi:hypothetical protein
MSIDLLCRRMPEPDTHGIMKLKQRHLNMVGILADCDHLDMKQMHHQLVTHYDYFFGPLTVRPAVPSDDFRKSWVASMVCDLIEARRWWLKRYAQLIAGPTPPAT